MKIKSGLTLIELLLSLAMFGIIILVISLIFTSGIKTYLEGYKISTLIQNGESAMSGLGSKKGILWDIRISSCIAALQSDRLDLITVKSSTVSYYISGNILNRSEGNSVVPISKNVKSFNLKYYYFDFVNNIISTAAVTSDVQTVNVNLVFSSGDKDINYNSNAYLRNQ